MAWLKRTWYLRRSTTKLSAMSKRLVLVGNGMAGLRFVERLIDTGDRWSVTVFGDEPDPAYDRVALSKVLAGDIEADSTVLRDRAWYANSGVRLEAGCPVVAIDPEGRFVEDARGRRHEYDALVLATGSLPFLPPVEGSDLDGVMTFRTLCEVREMVQRAGAGGRAVVVGGGLLGLECARGLQARGMEVSVVHLMDRLMERQLDGPAAELVRAEVERLGIRVVLSTTTRRIEGTGRVERVVLTDGEEIATDLVVVCAGIRPNTRLAAAAGLDVGRGIRVDDRLHTSAAHVYAIGECIEHRGLTFGLVEPVYQQAEVLARVIGREEAIGYEPRLSATVLKVAGVDVFAGGDAVPQAGDQEVVLRDDGGFIYKKLVLRDGRVVGAALLGDLRTAPLISNAMSTGAVVEDRLKLLGVGLGEGSVGVEDLPAEAVVCGCNGVTKATITSAITAVGGGCETRACVASCTRASSSCGSCGTVVDALLKSAGRAAGAPAAEVVCACVPVGRERLRAQVLEAGIRTVGAVLQRFGDGVGCHRCRPALSYYLDAWWCGEHEEEVRSRHVNDRVHANVQRDGSFSVVPRMRGGITSPQELRRIADVAERHGVGMVKLTGGQRIDLLGVRKQALPLIWAELGMPSGHAYTKAIRTVKSCVGTDWCRFGVGDSTSLAVAMEEMLEGLYCPHKVKLGVTGCPRNCAEVTVKDLGVMAISGGWEIYVGGAAGMSVRKGDLLCTVTTAEEALEASAIAIQHYREEANYLERLYHFVPRVGMDAFKAATVDAPEPVRGALLERFRRSRANAVDPWRAVPERDPRRFAAQPVEQLPA